MRPIRLSQHQMLAPDAFVQLILRVLQPGTSLPIRRLTAGSLPGAIKKNCAYGTLCALKGAIPQGRLSEEAAIAGRSPETMQPEAKECAGAKSATTENTGIDPATRLRVDRTSCRTFCRNASDHPA